MKIILGFMLLGFLALIIYAIKRERRNWMPDTPEWLEGDESEKVK